MVVYVGQSIGNVYTALGVPYTVLLVVAIDGLLGVFINNTFAVVRF